ncbi:MAG TPA: Holliday junction resolvase RuvX [Oligoflexia bacterium]|nr:Holliday junction resolvase RuvX [Oligoflexia bacterium]HMP48967.1 Holliday junction resolvase RuvX [Oligoflexia bacterium]
MINPRKRALALDVGKKRIGLAISDELHISSSPLKCIDLGQNRGKAIKDIVLVCKELSVGVIVVGYPLSLDGSKNIQTAFTDKFISSLQDALDKDDVTSGNISIVTWDERMSSVEAERYLKGSGKKSLERRRAKDNISALILLESYLLSKSHN